MTNSANSHCHQLAPAQRPGLVLLAEVPLEQQKQGHYRHHRQHDIVQHLLRHDQVELRPHPGPHQRPRRPGQGQQAGAVEHAGVGAGQQDDAHHIGHGDQPAAGHQLRQGGQGGPVAQGAGPEQLPQGHVLDEQGAPGGQGAADGDGSDGAELQPGQDQQGGGGQVRENPSSRAATIWASTFWMGNRKDSPP